MPRIRIGADSINYETSAAGRRRGRCVVMIHGAGQGAACWERQIEALKQYGRFPAVAVDLPGHGRSGGRAMDSMEGYAEFVQKFCAAADMENPVLIGHSMGGRIAQLLALRGGINPSGCLLAATGTRIRVSRWSLKTVLADYKTFCETAAKNAFGSAAPDGVREVFLNRLLSTPADTSHRDLLACDGFDGSESAGRITAPTVIVAGETDVLTPAKHTAALRRSIRGSKLFTVDGAGHFMMMERPDAFNKIMIDFLNLL